MVKISAEQIICPNLMKAYIDANNDADSRVTRPGSGVVWPEDYGNHVSTKGSVTGKSSCGGCGKKIQVDLTFSRVKGAIDENTSKGVTLYDTSFPKVSVQVGGTKCVKENKQR